MATTVKPKRCPACNANRVEDYKINSSALDPFRVGKRCTICSAQWVGDLLWNRELLNA